MNNILITGATGFVGKHLSKTLKTQNDNIVELNSKNFNSIWDYKEKFDYIIHLAVKTAAGGYCQNHPGEQYLINSDINNTILKYWKEYQPQAKMITFGSSCGYDKNNVKTEDNYLKGETEPGYEAYGAIKRNLLVGLQSLKKEYNMEYSYLIPSVFYGPEYDLDDKHFIFDLIRKIVNAKNGGDKVILWGTGDQTRELIYINDAVDIIIKSMSWNKHTVNLSSGKSHSIKEYAQIICDVVGYDSNLIEWDTTAFVGSPNKKLINTHLQDYNFTSLKEGLIETIKYYENRSSSSK
jgi:nucleoside-diphosphate-sugar epimerase